MFSRRVRFRSKFSIGDRVGYALPPHGAYSEERVYPVEKLIKIPNSWSNQSDQDLAALMLKGLTAQFLLRRTYFVKPGDVILVHAAAGGMGLILCQWAKYLGATIIGIMGDGNSTLDRYSDIVINIGDAEEACPLNMAPTTSSTVTMVLGDAMAVALMKMRGFDIDDYALLHPGGQIGKRLTVRVSDIMLKGSSNPIINITESVKNCISEISRKLAGAVSVVDNDGKIMGLVTDYDIRKHIEKEENIFSMKIEEIMNSKPIFIYEDEKAFSALKIMQERERPITILSVLDRQNIVVGMLRMHDLVKEGL